MLKRLSFFLVFMCLGFTLHGQEYQTWYQGGFRLKVLSAKMTIDSDLVDLSQSDSEIGYQVGFFGRLNVDKIYVQPELLFSKIKTDLVFQDYDNINGFNPRADFEFNTLEIPLDIGYRIGDFRMFFGPSISILISGERSFLNEVQRVTEDYNRTNLLWHFGVGGDFDKVIIDVNYEFGLSKTGESLSNIVGTEFVPKQRQWVFAIGLNIFDDY
ncbi:outer membrane protein with beta-barrel domain [Roseivirga pacifica]|uniref:Outer membrane protein beta-barrel domain-containing protein n=2 Tax=Roseivirga pacifica TaxID=1267423 RepID=A0A1I0Q036_9BACT|nr:outer membrane protein with beta-barrel domain [Roseivirga pacifica]SEW20148.1 Outer membrane protein beta-barrel domain-containing protein [Roseivirga pacifica]